MHIMAQFNHQESQSGAQLSGTGRAEAPPRPATPLPPAGVLRTPERNPWHIHTMEYYAAVTWGVWEVWEAWGIWGVWEGWEA